MKLTIIGLREHGPITKQEDGYFRFQSLGGCVIKRGAKVSVAGLKDAMDVGRISSWRLLQKHDVVRQSRTSELCLDLRNSLLGGQRRC